MRADRRLTYHLGERRPTPPAMLDLLSERKAALEAEIAEHFRAARQAGAVADVKALSAMLRALKVQIIRAQAY